MSSSDRITSPHGCFRSEQIGKLTARALNLPLSGTALDPGPHRNPHPGDSSGGHPELLNIFLTQHRTTARNDRNCPSAFDY
ncbi:hypothetical protein [Streptomyces lavendofoliae]|uniref:hypothetical protein n=1 Tax=Streptomyces lavendofoliae TaxID=67314 RepID=UPI003D8A4FD3